MWKAPQEAQPLVCSNSIPTAWPLAPSTDWISRLHIDTMLAHIPWVYVGYVYTYIYIYGYGSIPIDTFLVGWTSINPSYFDVNYRGTIGFDPSPYVGIPWILTNQYAWHLEHFFLNPPRKTGFFLITRFYPMANRTEYAVNGISMEYFVVNGKIQLVVFFTIQWRYPVLVMKNINKYGIDNLVIFRLYLLKIGFSIAHFKKTNIPEGMQEKKVIIFHV